jgi:hypothetical protein
MRNRINEINVTISDRDTDVSGCTWDGAFWHWTVTFDREGKSFTVPYYGGSAVEEITEEEVLTNCLQEALAFIQTDGFEDFCNEFGYDIFDFDDDTCEQSKKSGEIYFACMKMYCDFCHILDFGLHALEGEACDWLNEHNL